MSTHFSAFPGDPCTGSSPGVCQLLSWARSWEAGCEPPGNSQWSERGLPESAGALGPPVCQFELGFFLVIRGDELILVFMDVLCCGLPTMGMIFKQPQRKIYLARAAPHLTDVSPAFAPIWTSGWEDQLSCRGSRQVGLPTGKLQCIYTWVLHLTGGGLPSLDSASFFSGFSQVVPTDLVHISCQVGRQPAAPTVG